MQFAFLSGPQGKERKEKREKCLHVSHAPEKCKLISPSAGSHCADFYRTLLLPRYCLFLNAVQIGSLLSAFKENRGCRGSIGLLMLC